MGRPSDIVDGTLADKTDINPIIADMVSQTETGYTQTIPSPKTASYIIIKDGSDYRAINGLTNVSDDDDTSFHELMERIIANYISIYLTPNTTYTATDEIDVGTKHDWTVFSNSWSALIEQTTDNKCIFDIEDSDRWRLQGFKMLGNSANSPYANEVAHVRAWDCNSYVLHRLFSEDAYGYFLHSKADDDALTERIEVSHCRGKDVGHNFVSIASVKGCWIHHNYSDKTYPCVNPAGPKTDEQENLYVGAQTGKSDCEDIWIYDNWLKGGETGITLSIFNGSVGQIHDFWLLRNHIEDISDDSGNGSGEIRVYGAWYGYIKRNRIYRTNTGETSPHILFYNPAGAAIEYKGIKCNWNEIHCGGSNSVFADGIGVVTAGANDPYFTKCWFVGNDIYSVVANAQAIDLPSASNDYVIAMLNQTEDSIDIAGNGNGIEDHNIESVPDP